MNDTISKLKSNVHRFYRHGQEIYNLGLALKKCCYLTLDINDVVREIVGHILGHSNTLLRRLSSRHLYLINCIVLYIEHNIVVVQIIIFRFL